MTYPRLSGSGQVLFNALYKYPVDVFRNDGRALQSPVRCDDIRDHGSDFGALVRRPTSNSRARHATAKDDARHAAGPAQRSA